MRCWSPIKCGFQVHTICKGSPERNSNYLFRLELLSVHFFGVCFTLMNLFDFG